MNTPQSGLYKNLIFHAMVPIVALLVVHTVGVYAQLYWLFPWYDIMTHAWGGIVIGFLVMAVMARFFTVTASQFPTIKKQLLWFGIIIAIAIGWELYEFIINNVIAGWKFDHFDTLMDIINDLVGAWIAWMWAKVFVLPRY